jgi:hypothetical protein
MPEKLVIERRGSMINQTAERLWSAGILMLSPARLIDRLLDRLEMLSRELMPAQAGNLLCEQIQIEAHLDHFSATSTGDHTRYKQGF